MSFILTVWPQSPNVPLPVSVMQAVQQLEQLQDSAGKQPEARFVALARALERRFPSTETGADYLYDHGLQLLEQSPDLDQTYNIGVSTHNERFELGYEHLVAEANRLGLHVMDEQNGLVHLSVAGGSGRCLRLGDSSDPDPVAHASLSGVDAATAEQAKLLGIDGDWIAQAMAGTAEAQYNLGMLLLGPNGTPTPMQAQLGVMWLERAGECQHFCVRGGLGFIHAGVRLWVTRGPSGLHARYPQ